MKPIRFLHTADLHLGSPLKSIGAVSDAVRGHLQNATFRALERIIDAALLHEVDFVVFAGDVFDADSRSIRGNQVLVEQLARLEKKKISAFLIGGNHDPVTAFHQESLTLPSNVTVFPSEEVRQEIVRKDGEPIARVLGQSYRGKSDSRKMYAGFTVPDTALWNIGILHSALDVQNKNYVPCTMGDLRSKSDMHYWALGHIHNQQVLSDEFPVIAYPGIPQGRDIGEPGIESCLLVELAPESRVSITRIPTGSVVWLNEVFSIEQDCARPPKTLDELVRAMESTAGDRVEEFFETVMASFPGDDNNRSELVDGVIIRWRITGRGEIHTRLTDDRTEAAEYFTDELRKRLQGRYPFIWTESVHIRTSPEIPTLEQLAEESDTFRDIAEMIAELHNNQDDRTDIFDIVGEIWETDGDPESLAPEKFLMTDDLLTEFIEEAKHRIVEAILEQREQL